MVWDNHQHGQLLIDQHNGRSSNFLSGTHEAIHRLILFRDIRWDQIRINNTYNSSPVISNTFVASRYTPYQDIVDTGANIADVICMAAIEFCGFLLDIKTSHDEFMQMCAIFVLLSNNFINFFLLILLSRCREYHQGISQYYSNTETNWPTQLCWCVCGAGWYVLQKLPLFKAS